MLRKITTALAAGALLAGLGLATSGTAQAAPTFAKVYFNTTVTQWTHYTPDARNSSHAGTLNGGRNYFYCWVEGEYYTSGARTSAFWLRTDDDTGHRNVYVSDVNFDQYGWTHAVTLVPHC